MSLNRSKEKQVKSSTNSGIFSVLESIVRSHPLLYYYVRQLVKYTSIFEEDANGTKFLMFKNSLNIIDVGASDGIASKFFLNNLNVKKIICFEPDKNYVKILKKLNNKVIVRPYAIGEKTKYTTVYYPEYTIFGRKYRLITYCYYNKDILKRQLELDFKFRKKLKIIKQKIRIQKIKKINIKIDLIKIDVNGYEFSVIKGIKDIIKRDKPALLIETGAETRKIKNFLKTYSYKHYVYSNKKKNFYKAEKDYPLDTYFLQNHHLNSN
jgi:FkbM family methyltransferase